MYEHVSGSTFKRHAFKFYQFTKLFDKKNLLASNNFV